MTHPCYCDYASFLSQYFEGKVQKLSVDGGFGCPNRDGTVGWGGCAYCNNETFTPSYCLAGDTVTMQLEKGKQFFARKYPDMRYLAYFQAHTNTYAPLDELRRKYEEALCVSGVVGLVIGTRPDCMPDALLDYLENLSHRTFVMVEYGIESTNDALLEKLHRGHTFQQTADAVRRTAERGLPVGGHVILGLPGETFPGLLRGSEMLSALPLSVLKLHQLQIVKRTPMALDYAAHPEHYTLLYSTPEAYADVVIRYLQHLRPDMAVERFTSQSPDALLLAPRWGMKNYEFVALLQRRMKDQGVWQGQLYGGELCEK